MIARKLHVYAVAVPVGGPQASTRFQPRARDLLPQADPYIVGLIRKLQDEVRAEKSALKHRVGMVSNLVQPRIEVPPPWSEQPFEFENPRQETELRPLLRDRDDDD